MWHCDDRSLLKHIALFFVLCLTASTASAALVWTGAINDTWDTTTLNWFDTAPTTFTPGSNVLFDATTSVSAVFIDEPVVADDVVFDALDYVINGGSTLTVTDSLTVGSGLTVTINAPIADDLFLVGEGTIFILGGVSGNVDTSSFGGEVLFELPPPPDPPGPIPLPATLPLLLAGLGALKTLRRNRRPA